MHWFAIRKYLSQGNRIICQFKERAKRPAQPSQECAIFALIEFLGFSHLFSPSQDIKPLIANVRVLKVGHQMIIASFIIFS